MTEHKKEVAEQFGRMADAYASSEGHARGRDLNIVLSALNPSPRYRVLDVATGAGHTAVFLAPHVASVLATDMSDRMIGRARELAVRSQSDNVRLAVMDAEQQPSGNRASGLPDSRSSRSTGFGSDKIAEQTAKTVF
jgi:ubiquinone/menaquinone biosynthesis C-methylase UbiE